MYVVVRPSKTVVNTRTCPFHERHPGGNFPGCTCATSVSTVEKPMDEWTKEESDWYFAALRGECPDGTPLF